MIVGDAVLPRVVAIHHYVCFLLQFGSMRPQLLRHFGNNDNDDDAVARVSKGSRHNEYQ